MDSNSSKCKWQTKVYFSNVYLNPPRKVDLTPKSLAPDTKQTQESPGSRNKRFLP